MKKSSLKKAAVVALTGLIMAQTALTGCGKRTVDYDVDGNASQNGGDKTNTSDRAGIGGKLGVPESCNETIDVGASTLGSITINCENVQTPNADKMDIVYFTPHIFTNEEKKKMAEAIFDKEKGIYLHDYEHRIKSEIQEDIDGYKEQIERAQEEGDTSWITFLEEEINNLETELASAPESYPEAGDYSGEAFLGTIGDVEYYLSMYSYGSDSEDADSAKSAMTGMGSYVSFGTSNEDISIRPYEGAVSGYMSEWADEREELGANMSSMTAEEAEDIASDFLADFGITDVEMTNTADLYWQYYDENGETLATETEGYAISCLRAVGGSSIYNGNVYNVDNLQLDNGWLSMPVETFSLYVYDGKVVQAYWQQIFSQADSVDENVELLSYEKIIENANAEMSKYYEKYPTRYKKVEFNDVRLTYYLVSDGEGKCKYIPVWVFSQYEEYTDSDASDAPEQLVIMNAMDGSIIDIIEEAKALGCYEEWN